MDSYHSRSSSAVLAKSVPTLSAFWSPKRAEKTVSLSKYFPYGTVFFYGFPAGVESKFFNAIPPWVEELVAARPLTCAGNGVRVVTFHATSNPRLRALLEQECGVPLVNEEDVLALPEDINAQVEGAKRNALVKKALKHLSSKDELIMAQPFLDPELRPAYRIPPELTIWLNDKKNMSQYIPAEFLPKRYATFADGTAFASDMQKFALPCVVKVSSSSAGDGVRICRSEQEVAEAKKTFAYMEGAIFVEEFIEVKHNFCIQFGISHDSGEIEMIGFNEQFIDRRGEFLGGIVHPENPYPVVDEINEILEEQVLPNIRALGWYGVGGIDVLVSQNGKMYVIDPNFRHTATFAIVCLSKNKEIKKSAIGFHGTFTGDEKALRQSLLRFARKGSLEQSVQMVSLSHDGQKTYRFNAALLFSQAEEMKAGAEMLLKNGIESAVLGKLAVA